MTLSLAIESPQQYDIVSKKKIVLNRAEHLLHLENVTKTYSSREGTKLVLDDVDLRVRKGEFIALVGPSGCGKSTLLRLILGDEEPTSGIVCLDGQPVGFPDPSRGIVYQQYSLFPNLTVIDNILRGVTWKFRDKFFHGKELRERAIEYLKTAQLEEHVDKYPHELSGGQRQRVACLQALMTDPKILLMDEPFGALDPGSRERMQTFILSQWEKTGKTIFFVTHDLEEAVFLGTRVVVLSQYYTDDRKGIAERGSRIVCDIKTGIVGQAQSTKSKLDPKFTQTIEHIRDMGFKPDHLHHVREFDLSHDDSFHTVTPEEVNGTS